MSINTPNMGLIKWTEGTDSYDHTELASNFQKIDEHDHTPGKGKQLKGASLEEGSISTAQLAGASVTNPKLAGGITADKLAPGVLGFLGELKWFWRPNIFTSVPTGGFVICAGQTLGPTEHEFPGGGNIVLPNQINRFVIGTELGFVGNAGGASSVSLAHSHNVNPHTHTIGPHSHFLNLETGYNANTNLKISQDNSGNAWVHSDNQNNTPHKHSIGGSSESVGLTTDASGATTDTQLSSFSIVPPYIGWLPLVRVKYS